MVRYAIAVIAAVGALLVRIALTPLIQADGAPYITFVLATALSAGYGGLGPGLVTTVCSTVFVEYVVYPQAGIAPFADRGNVIRFLLICVVISYVCRVLIRTGERARAAEVSERKERRFSQQTMAAIGDGVISTDNLGRVQFLNPVAQRLTGFSAVDAKGQPLETVCRMEKGHVVRREGLRVPVEYHDEPIKDEKGQIVGSVVVVRDITERLAEEERRRGSEARLREANLVYRALGESIPFGVWICDRAGRNTYASSSFLRMVGMTQEQCSEYGWGNSLHPDQREATLAAWEECVRSGGTWDREHLFRGVDGVDHPVLARGVPVRDEDGSVLCWAGINLDIQRIKKTEVMLERQAADLARSNRELEQFAYVASHDLQEPLRMVNVYTELLLRESGGKLSSQSEEYARFVRQGVDRMLRLIDDLLAFSRVVHGDTERKPVEAGAALEQALSLCQQIMQDAGAVVKAQELPRVVAQEGPLTLIFQNLITNAIKYRRPEVTPRIEIQAAPEADTALFSVHDNGIGFDPAYAKTIFGLFKRLHGDEYPGTGMGLAICQRIVERFGGQIWADSKVGEGSTFYFQLPLG